MTIMDMVRRMKEKKAVSSARFKEVQEERKIQRTLDEREKSSNERELERHFKEKREADIKGQLDKIRVQKNHENWKGNNLSKGNSILKDDRPILKEKNIFSDNRSNNPMTKGDMFFKW